MSDKPVRDPNQPFPKDEKKSSFGGKVLKFLVFVAFLLVLATMITYSLQIKAWPWEWTPEQWQGYLSFSKEKAQNVEDKVTNYDWNNLKTKVTGKTKELWTEAPGVLEKIEEKLGMKNSGGTPAKPADGQPAAQPGAPPAPTNVTPERQIALEMMRDAITHYRKSPNDPAELAAAKLGFEGASGHFEKALKETNDGTAKSEIQQELNDCNRYLEDCRAREKS
jgi:hypothetical protein